MQIGWNKIKRICRKGERIVVIGDCDMRTRQKGCDELLSRGWVR